MISSVAGFMEKMDLSEVKRHLRECVGIIPPMTEGEKAQRTEEQVVG
jgi:hypothetical protein